MVKLWHSPSAAGLHLVIVRLDSGAELHAKGRFEGHIPDLEGFKLLAPVLTVEQGCEGGWLKFENAAGTKFTFEVIGDIEIRAADDAHGEALNA